MNIKLRKQCLGMGLIGWVVAIPVVLVVIAFLFCEANKAYWDHKVTEMCEKDGGVTVYENVTLTQEEYERNDGKNGVIRVMSESTSKNNHQYAWSNTDTVINETNPYVRRSEYITYRKSDKKELGKWITYSRRGGDLPIGFHPSSFSCSDIPNFEKNITKKIFSYKGE